MNVKGKVLRCEWTHAQERHAPHRVASRAADERADQIELHCTQHAVPLEQSSNRFAGAGIGGREKPINWVLSTRHGRRSGEPPRAHSVGGRVRGSGGLSVACWRR